MKKIQKILIALLAMLLCAATLVSCGSGGMQGGFGAFESGDATTGDGSETKDPDVGTSTSDLSIIKSSGGRLTSDYQIVYSEAGKDWETEMALNLQSAIEKITGVTIPLKNDIEYEDEPNTLRQDKEIVVGEMTNRYDEYEIPSGHDIYNLGYTIFAAKERLVIIGGSRTGMYFALRDFIKEQFNQDLDKLDKDVTALSATDASLATLVLSADYATSRTINSQHLPYVDIAFSKYKIMYDDYDDQNSGTGYMMKRMAYGIRQGIVDATGARPSVTPATAKPSGAVVLLQLLDKEEIEGEENEWIEPGKWTIEYSDKMFVVKASSYYGFFDAANFFSTELNSFGFYDFGEDEFSASGDYLDNATGHYESTQYAYNKQGDYRVMYLNVLFGSTAGGDGGPTYQVPPAERNRIQQIMMAEYMPDVLGCQEFNKTKRGVSEALALGGSGGLVELLAELGYAETVDPRVKNSYETDEVIPDADPSLVQKGASSTDKLYGYGHGGADLVNYNGVQYSYYNNTPLFYNTNTTKLIASEYYWYKYQWDKREALDENGEVIVHENGASDAGSKSLTWGVFESLETGQQYIVISTHMCTRSDYIRSLQAKEVVEVINKLIATYDCPVFFGGDINGNNDDSNYNHFISDEVGYISLQDTLINGKHLANIFTSQTASAHGYPNYDNDLRIMTPGSNDERNLYYVDVNTKGRNSIDQTFVTNLNEDVEINVFGFIVDDCSLSSSDHLPHFVDFSIKGETNEGAEWGPTVVG